MSSGGLHTERSQYLMAQSKHYMPGGVSNPIHAFIGVGGNPLCLERGKGSRVIDVDGNEYIDYVGSYGPFILGHARTEVLQALKRAMQRGTLLGTTTDVELELAKRITSAIPSVEKIRFVNSGTEAVLSAIRLARAFSKREKIVKFTGGYHGYADDVLVNSTSCAVGVDGSVGVPLQQRRNTLLSTYNDIDGIESVFRDHAKRIAAVIVEPVATNMGVVPAHAAFLRRLSELTHEKGALLIFDEVVTGFRLTYGSTEKMHGVVPDLTCLGKIIGGGLPVGAYGGPRRIMDLLSPLGDVYQGGTFSGNHLTMSVGLETLRLLSSSYQAYSRLEKRSSQLEDGLKKAAKQANIPIQLNRVGSLFSIFFASWPVVNYETAWEANYKEYAAFFWGMLRSGAYFPPTQLQSGFVSLAHTSKDIDATVEAAAQVFQGDELQRLHNR